jgi:hypothetical protein
VFRIHDIVQGELRFAGEMKSMTTENAMSEERRRKGEWRREKGGGGGMREEGGE